MNYSSEILSPTVIKKVDRGVSNHYFLLKYLWVLEEAENYDDRPELMI